MNIDTSRAKSTVQTVKVVGNGKVTIPAEFRRAAGIEPGDNVIIELGEDGTIQLRSIRAGLMRAQKLICEFYADKGGDQRSIVDEFIAERRLEAERE